MTTAGRVLDVARSQIGTVQARDGSNKYGAAYGMDRVAWCAQFTWWVFQQAGAGHLHPNRAGDRLIADRMTPIIADALDRWRARQEGAA